MSQGNSNLPPAQDRYFSNLISIADRIILINNRAKQYYDANKDSYTRQNPQWNYPILAPFTLKSGLEYLKKKDHMTCMLRFIEGSYVHWDAIAAKQTSYFLTLAEELFKDVPYGVTEVKALFVERRLDQTSFVTPADEEFLWGRIQAMVRISMNFIREQRNENLGVYPDIDLEKYTALFTPAAKTS